MHLPRESIIKRTIRNRLDEFPPQPATLRDLVIEPEGMWALTSGDIPERFLFFDNGPESLARTIAFAADDDLRYLATTRIWNMDGCFAMAPPGFQ